MFLEKWKLSILDLLDALRQSFWHRKREIAATMATLSTPLKSLPPPYHYCDRNIELFLGIEN